MARRLPVLTRRTGKYYEVLGEPNGDGKPSLVSEYHTTVKSLLYSSEREVVTNIDTEAFLVDTALNEANGLDKYDHSLFFLPSTQSGGEGKEQLMTYDTVAKRLLEEWESLDRREWEERVEEVQGEGGGRESVDINWEVECEERRSVMSDRGEGEDGDEAEEEEKWDAEDMREYFEGKVEDAEDEDWIIEEEVETPKPKLKYIMTMTERPREKATSKRGARDTQTHA